MRSADCRAQGLRLFIYVMGSMLISGRSVADVGRQATAEPSQTSSGPGIAYAKGGYEFTAKRAIREAQIAFPMPLLFEHQTPLTFALTVQPTRALKRCDYLQRTVHNWIVRVTFRPLQRGQRVRLNWRSTVLIRPSDYAKLPKSAPLPTLAQLPADVRPWLRATRSVQVHHPSIQARAGPLRTAEDLMQIVHNIGSLQEELPDKHPITTDAVEALAKGGSCTSCANLTAALLRANGIPTRILACYPTENFPYQTHYIVQFYLPHHGWVRMESSTGEAPHEPYQEVVVAVVAPQDEERSFDTPRWAVQGVPYLSLTENLHSPGLEITKMLPPPADTAGAFGLFDAPADHMAGMVHLLPESDPASWDRACGLAASVWRACLRRLQRHEALPKGLAAAQRRAADSHTLAELILRLQQAQRLL